MARFPRIFLSALFLSLTIFDAAAVEQAIQPITPTASEAEAAAAGTPTASPFDVGFGISFTSDSVSRGITNSANDPAIQGYIEPSIGPVYFNVWSSNVNFGEDFEGAEIDTAIGSGRSSGPCRSTSATR